MKVIQIAIENTHTEGGFPATFLWALTDTGRIFVRVHGNWMEEDGPDEADVEPAKPREGEPS